MRHKDGHWVWVLDRGKVSEWDSDGRPLRMIGTHLDVTARKRAEEAIENTLWFQQVSMDAISSPIFYKNAECVHIGGNKAYPDRDVRAGRSWTERGGHETVPS